MPFPSPWFTNRTAILATMHRKEQVIAPVLEPLGLKILVPEAFDTDRFGTFSREIPRSGSQLEAARAKAHRAMELTGYDLALASEGAFGPHPAIPYLPCNRELILLVDRQNQFEIVGEALSTETNYSHSWVNSLEEAQQFAQRIGFPEHGLVVIAGAERQADGSSGVSSVTGNITKGITQELQLIEAVEQGLRLGEVWLETDMRALYNPKRMRVIQQAAANLVQKLGHTCPQCGAPGFEIVERQPGLPCSWCHSPTLLIRAVVEGCQRCGFSREAQFPEGNTSADPTYCPLCNP